MTGGEDDLEAQADALLTAAADEAPNLNPEDDPLPGTTQGIQVRQLAQRKPRSYHACYACVDVGGRPLTEVEAFALRSVGQALLDSQCWLGWLSGWLTLGNGTVLERLEFRTQAPAPHERLAFVEVVKDESRRSRAPRPRRKRPQTRRDP